ncbi:MAG: response regulator transcription factor [Levilactobacillus sp.]|jgi:two-component system response regulator NreC|uniref:DNA-binding response regulator n=1 Tax=Levilactobacillus suantsaiihabitans TaxID=2487722 RepID=A0A4Z0J6T8_9LACO|nr:MULTISPECIES: response regulator transcription factor [Levilactobacillus]MCI1553610.1 response regulator transcription factor [Levilactobacillus sp.]MCI1605289.1 response regulator transcription factor [Levilactobacillus sp.]TGD18296.1 DNA-binding response regulator [Levilactobacillus suantsaiihabitans]
MYKVLVADDHAIVREGLKKIIDQQPDYQVVAEAANGNDTFVRAGRGDIDMIIMDLSMPPGESGLVTTKRIHNQYPKIWILILSMHGEEDYVDQAIKNGAAGYVLKSSPDSEIINAITTIVNGRHYVDENVILLKSDIKDILTDVDKTNLWGHSPLSKREREVMPLVALGYSNKEVAAKLNITTKTVEAHKANIMRKLELDSHVDLVRYAIHHKLIEF